ncbi:MAG: ABC transporter permease, partial [Ruminococcus sp.]
MKKHSRNPVRIRIVCRLLFPAAVMGGILLIHLGIPNTYPKNYTSHTYPLLLMWGLVLYVLLAVISFFLSTLQKKLCYIAWSLSAALVLLEVFDIATLKTGTLKLPYMPSPDQILQTIPDYYDTLIESAIASFKRLAEGIFFGVLFGMISGILMGWSRIWNYWLSPILKFIGPIPAIAWLPIVMTLMPNSNSAGIFLIFLSVWFPITLNLSSAIRNTEKRWIETARIMGASERYILLHVAIPSALPALFNGLFMGVCSSFSALLSAEMLGVQSGLGWYLQWAKSWAEYARVYSTVLIFIAMFFL